MEKLRETTFFNEALFRLYCSKFYIKKGEKKLKKLTDKAIKNNDDFTSNAENENSNHPQELEDVTFLNNVIEILKEFPEEYFDEINAFFDLLSYKVSVLSKKEINGVIPGLTQGKWKYPKDINAFDEDLADEFEAYL